jgi:hypothetical protein
VVDGAEVCVWAREDAAEKQLDEFKGHGVGACILFEADVITMDGDEGTIGLSLSGHTSHTIMVWQILFCLWDGMS